MRLHFVLISAVAQSLGNGLQTLTGVHYAGDRCDVPVAISRSGSGVCGRLSVGCWSLGVDEEAREDGAFDEWVELWKDEVRLGAGAA